MRAPSADLLRALRSATLAAPRHQISTQCHPAPGPFSRLALHSPTSCRHLSTTSHLRSPYTPSQSRSTKSSAPATHDRGPKSTEDTQTDFGQMDIFGSTATPATAIDACTTDGFHLNNGVKTGGGSGILLFGGEAFTWQPWSGSTSTAGEAKIGDLLSRTGILEIPAASFGLLDLLYPKPDLLIVGTGSKLWMLGKEAREYLTRMGVRVDVMDTGNASAAYNLLATERGVEGVGAALLPVGWKGKMK